MPVVKDRRSSLRVEVEGRARIHTDRDEFEGRCVDLGLDGIALRSTRAARPGELVTLEALVDGQALRVEAKLVRRQRAGGEYLLGLAFVDVDLDMQRRIEHLLFERLAGSPQAELMRAFVAHADRVPPPVAREGMVERTVIAGVLQVPVISGHTQVIALDQLPRVDRTVIAPPPPRGETVVAEVAEVLEELDASEVEPGAPDEAWLDDEMDTAQFRLLEAAQARERAEREAAGVDATEVDATEAEVLELLEPDDPVPEHTVVVSGFTVPPLVDRTELVLEEDRPPRERTLVTSEAPERPLVERTAPLSSGELLPRLRPRGTPEPVAPAHGATQRVPLEPEAPGERTVPFLRDLLLGVRRLDASTPDAPERTAVVAPASVDAEAVLRPSLRALLEAKALLRPDASSASERGPRVVVAVPHHTFRRIASAPWNQR